MKKLTQKDLVTILQSLENEYRIHWLVDDITDEDTQKWGIEVERVINKIKGMIK